MKKSVFIFFVLLFISIGSVSWIHVSLLSVKDQVTFEDTIHYGEKSMIDGMTVWTESVLKERLFWDTSYTAGNPPIVTTDYTMESSPKRIHYWNENPYIYFDSELDYNLSYEYDSKSFLSPENRLNQACQDLYDSLGADEKGRTLITLKDYYDYYPLSFSINFDDNGIHYSYADYDNYGDDEYGLEMRKNFDTLRNFFRIPVSEDDKRYLEISKVNNQPDMIGLYSANDNGNYYFQTYSAMTNGQMYFTFHTLSGTDLTPYDTTLIPGGYGIYSIPCDERELADGNMEYTPRIQELSMVYPLDPSICMYHFFLTEDESKLVLAYTQEKENQTLTVVEILDAKTMKQVQYFTLDNVAKPDGSREILLPYESFIYNDFFVLECSSDYLAIFSLGEDNLYDLEYVVNIHENPVFDTYIYSGPNTAMDYKDGTLAVVGQLEFEYEQIRCESCGFYIAVFGKDGLEYYSTHESSLDKGNSHLTRSYIGWAWPASRYSISAITPEEERNPLHVEWN